MMKSFCVLLTALVVFFNSGVILCDNFTNIMFIPPVKQTFQKPIKLKTILSMNVLLKWYNVSEGTELFTELKCLVNTCRLTKSWEEKDTADMIIYFHEPFYEASSPKQVQAYFQMEPPHITKPLLMNTGENFIPLK